jgi:hypothetical protein
MKVTKQSEMVELTEYFHQYRWPDYPGSGFIFPSDADGEIDESGLCLEARENLATARAECRDTGVMAYTHHYRESAEGICDCGRTIVLDCPWVNTCDHCGREYNGSGQELAPREQWGEETGESFI